VAPVACCLAVPVSDRQKAGESEWPTFRGSGIFPGYEICRNIATDAFEDRKGRVFESLDTRLVSRNERGPWDSIFETTCAAEPVEQLKKAAFGK
jgi:hypothetical protein